MTRNQGQGVRIAVLDSGLDRSHPRLAGLALVEHLTLECIGARVQAEPSEPNDPLGHGTAVIDILHRAAPAAEIGVFQILHRPPGTSAQVVAEAARLAARHGYRIVHCSLGSPARREDALLHKDWLDALYLRGIHVVAAGSNSGFAQPEWPAWFPTVVAVGACPSDSPGLRLQDGSLVEFLTSGRSTAAWTRGQTSDVVGSSFAAPKVTALLARLLAAFPSLDPLAAKSLLKAMARLGRDLPAE